MNKVKVLIVEDNADEAASIQVVLQSNNYVVCGIAGTLQQAYELYYNHQPDISVIDIYLHGKKDGLEYAQTMHSRQDAKHPFIFLTSAADKATFNSARLTSPYSYLLKPFNEMELQYAIELAVEKFACEEEGVFTAGGDAASIFIKDTIFVKKGNILAKILVNDIKYIEVDGKYCKFAYGNDKFVVQKSMKQLQDQLPANQFLRIHRNYIANLQSIQKINLQDSEIILQDGKSLTFSRRYLDDLMHVFYVLK